MLVGIAPHIRKTVSSRVERQRQTTQTRHQLYDHIPSAGLFKSSSAQWHRSIIAKIHKTADVIIYMMV